MSWDSPSMRLMLMEDKHGGQHVTVATPGNWNAMIINCEVYWIVGVYGGYPPNAVVVMKSIGGFNMTPPNQIRKDLALDVHHQRNYVITQRIDFNIMGQDLWFV